MKKKWLLLAPLVILGVMAVALFFVDKASKDNLEKALAQARKTGIALSPADMSKRVVPSAENAADEYRKAFANVATVSKGDQDLVEHYPAAMASKDPEAHFRKLAIMGKVDNARIQKALSAWKPAFAHIEKASQKPHLDWGRKWEMGMALTFPEFADAKAILKVMMLDAEMAASRGDLATLQTRIREGRRLADHIGEEPTLIASLVSIALHSIVSAQSTQIAYRFQKDTAVVATVRRSLEEKPRIPSLKNSLNGEMVSTRRSFVEIAKDLPAFTAQSGGDDEMKQFVADAKWLRLPWLRRDVEALVVSRLARAYEQLPEDPLDWSRTSAVLGDLDKEFAETDSRTKRIASIFAPVFSQSGVALVNIEIYRRQGILITHLIDARRASGKWPTTLQNSPANIDPFNGKPFLYRTTPAGFVLYSVGANGLDDGGDLGKGNADKMIGILDGKLIRRGR